MRRFFVALAILVLAVAGVMGFAAWRYSHALAIDSPNGIDEERFVRIGGIDQWIQIRGEDRANPVLLWVNGGPGFSTIPSTMFYREWEKYFTVVMWDQRGEGKTFRKYGTSVAPTMTIPRMTQDGLEVAQYLRGHLHKDKIILLGHSWGSILGTHMATERPDLFYAYVGTGQVEHLRNDIEYAYPRLLDRAQKQGNQKAFQEMTKVGPPPYARTDDSFVPIKWANALDPPMHRAFSLVSLWPLVTMDRSSFFGGADFSQEKMWPSMLADDLGSIAGKFAVPVVIIEGPADLVTPRAQSFFDKVAAPRKEYVLLPGTGHLAIFEDPAGFLAILRTHVRPLASPPSAAAAHQANYFR